MAQTYSVEAFMKATGAEQFSKAFQNAAKEVSGLQKKADSMKSIGKSMTKGITVPVIAMGTAIGVVGAKFDDQMSTVQAVTGATGKDLDLLREQAKEMGRETRYSATEAAEGMEALGRAGFDTTQTMDALPHVLDMAAANNMELGEAAGITANLMAGFSSEGLTAQDVADKLSYASRESQVDVQSLGEAMKYAAPMADMLGISFSDTTAAVGILGDNAIEAGQAGRMLRGGLQRLAAPTDNAAALMKDLGMEMFDANGEMKPLPAVIKELEGGLEGMSSQQKAAALETLFGKDAMSAWSILIDEGSDSLGEFSDEISESTGTASEMHDVMEDNLAGSMRSLKSALEGLAISFYEMGEGPMRTIIDKLKDLVTWFTDLDDKTKQWIIVIAGIAAAIGPVIFVISTLIGWFFKVKKILGAIKGVIAILGGPMTAFIAIAIAAAILIYKNWEPIKEFFINMWNKIKDLGISIWESIKEAWNAAVEFIKAVWEPIGEFFSSLWESIKEIALTVWEPIKEAWDAVVEFFTEVWADLTEWFSELWEDIKETALMVWEPIKELWDSVVEFLKMIWEPIKGFFEDFWNDIKIITEAVWEAIKGVFETVWEIISTIISTHIENIKTIISAAWEIIKTITTTVWDVIKTAIQTVWEVIKTVIETIINVIKTIIETVWNVIKGIIDVVMNLIKGDISGAWEAIKGIISTVLEGIRNIISNIWNGIKSVISSVMNGIKSILSSIWNSIKSIITSVVTSIKTVISNTFNALKSITSTAFNAVKNAVKTGITGALKVITGIAGKFKDAGKKIMTSVAEGITGAIGKVKDAAKGAVKAIRNFLPFSPAKEGPLKDLDRLNFEVMGEGIKDSQSTIQDLLAETLALPDVETVDISGWVSDINSDLDSQLNSDVTGELTVNKQPVNVYIDGDSEWIRAYVNENNAVDAEIRRF